MEDTTHKRKPAGTVEEGQSGKQAKGESGPMVGGRNKHYTSPEFVVTLLHTKAEELRPPQNTVFVAERTDKIVDVFKGLVKHNFLSVPVLQKTGRKWYGFLDMGDIVHYVCETFGTQLSTTQDFWTLFNKEEAFRKVTVKDVMKSPLSRSNPFHPVKGGYSLLYAIEALAKERNLYRVAVIDDDRQLLNLITDSQVLNYLYENMDKIGSKVDKPVSDMSNVIKEVISIKETQPAIDAFNLMIKEGVSGVAVVDDRGHLVGNLSIRDLKAMAPDGSLFWRLYGTAKSFLERLHAEYAGTGRPATVQTCTVNDIFKTVITKLAVNRIHRLYVVNALNKPIGVISLKDVLYEIVAN